MVSMFDSSSQLHAVDQQLLSQVTSFLFLHHSCDVGTTRLPLISSDLPDFVEPGSSPVQSCRLPFQLSSLLRSSRILAFTLTAFSESKLTPALLLRFQWYCG